MNPVHLDMTDFLFQAKSKLYPIQSGYVETMKTEYNNAQRDWEIAVELKKTDVIPNNEITYIPWPDYHSVFLKTQVLSRHKEGSLTILKLIPYLQNVVIQKDK